MPALLNSTIGPAAISLSPFLYQPPSLLPVIPHSNLSGAEPFSGRLAGWDMPSDVPQLFAGFQAPRAVAVHRKRHHKANGKGARSDSGQRKKRRSLNHPDPSKPRMARLHSTGRGRYRAAGGKGRGEGAGGKGRRKGEVVGQSTVEVLRSGDVRMSVSTSSAYSVLEVLLLCFVAPGAHRSCPVLMGEQRADRAVYSSVLLYFNETDRYLCVNGRGTVYSRLKSNESAVLQDCVFKHSTVASYDVYQVLSHPRTSPSCSSPSPAPAEGEPSPLAPPNNTRHCLQHWYLAADRRGRVRTIKLPPGETPTLRTYFLRQWIYRTHHHGQSHPPASPIGPPTATRPSSADSAANPERRRKGSKSESVFRILDRNQKPEDVDRRHGIDRRRGKGNCLNLLSADCEVDAKGNSRTKKVSHSESVLTGNVHRSEGERRTNAGFLSSGARHTGET